jgi:hypothetical protein
MITVLGDDRNAGSGGVEATMKYGGGWVVAVVR